MDQTQRGIITLLKSAVTQEPLALPEGFDMEAAYPLIRRHHMATLCFDGAARCGVSRQHPVMRQLFRQYCQTLAVSEGQMRQLERIFAAFDAGGIDYMPLKGCDMKALYPKPELRVMGDADILIRIEQYDKIASVMEGLGFESVLESNHELIWKTPALYLELHKYLIPSYNRDFYAYFGDGWRLAKVRSGARCAMTPEDTYLYLVTHFAKHYRDGGIGCRHVVDLWVYRAAHPDMDEGYVAAELEKLRLKDFHDHICRLLGVWFHGAPMDDRTDVLTACIFSGGSWGNKEDSLLSGVLREAAGSALGFSGRLVYLWGLLFPGREAMRQMYPILEKAPWLLPVAWVIRPVYKLLFQRGRLRRHGRNLDLLTRERLESRQRMLSYVGLDYNF